MVGINTWCLCWDRKFLSNTHCDSVPGSWPRVSAYWKTDKKTPWDDQRSHWCQGSKAGHHPKLLWGRGRDSGKTHQRDRPVCWTPATVQSVKKGADRRGEKTPESKRHVLVVLEGVSRSWRMPGGRGDTAEPGKALLPSSGIWALSWKPRWGPGEF